MFATFTQVEITIITQKLLTIFSPNRPDNLTAIYKLLGSTIQHRVCRTSSFSAVASIHTVLKYRPVLKHFITGTVQHPEHYLVTNSHVNM